MEARSRATTRAAGRTRRALTEETRLIATLVDVDLEQRGELLVPLRPDTRSEPLQLMAEAKCDGGVFDRVASPSQMRSADRSQRLATPRRRPHPPGVERSESHRAECGVAGDPFHATDELRERHGSSGGSGRRVGSGAELRAQPFERRSHGRAVLGIHRHASGTGVGYPGDGRDGGGEPAPELVVPRRWPEEEAGRNAERPGEQPTEEARPDRRDGLGHGDRKHEREKRGRRRRRGKRRDDPGIEDGEPHQGHGQHGRHFMGRRCRADNDETAASGKEREVSDEPRARRPREFHQQQEGERTERGEQVDLAVRKGEVCQSKDRRHDQGGAHRTLERQQGWVLGAVPTNGCHPGASCGTDERCGHLRHRAAYLLPEPRRFDMRSGPRRDP